MTTSVSFAETPKTESQIKDSFEKICYDAKNSCLTNDLWKILNESMALKKLQKGRNWSNIEELLKQKEKTWNGQYKNKYGNISFKKAIEFFEHYTIGKSTSELGKDDANRVAKSPTISSSQGEQNPGSDASGF